MIEGIIIGLTLGLIIAFIDDVQQRNRFEATFAENHHLRVMNRELDVENDKLKWKFRKGGKYR